MSGPRAKYPQLGKRIMQGLLLAASMSAATLGGCGGVVDSRSLDAIVDNGELDDTVETCDQEQGDCEEETENNSED